MSKFKAQFTLKQHTPIIHFQSTQSGATLRATELKPKFDKFLIKYAFNDEIPQEFLIDKDKKALNYKVNISSQGFDKTLPNSFLYFANNPIRNHQDKKFMLRSQHVEISFFSFKTEIVEIINRYFDDFMLISNFGARSSKGYGSFSSKIENIESKLKKYYSIVFKLKSVPDISRWEEKVDNTHKLLKSGINFRSYHKSLLFQYMCTKKLRWEKRKIKETFASLAQGKEPIDCNIKKEYRYIRAMLGLAGINEYAGKNIVTITHKDGNIDRFTSPITYKIINNDIYILGDKSYEDIADEIFIFKYGHNEFEIKTPSKKEFNLQEFLRFVEKQDNIIKEI